MHRRVIARPWMVLAGAAVLLGLSFWAMSIVEVDTSLPALRVLQVLDRLAGTRGLPQSLVVDHGPEFLSKALDAWAFRHGVRLEFIRPGKPVDNAYIESFHSRFRDECLNREQLWTLTEARVVLEDWRSEYNYLRPHKSLKLMTPKAFAEEQAGASGRATPSLRPRLDTTPIMERYNPYNLAVGLT